MDPHKHGKHLSRLGKKRGKHLKIVEAPVQTVNDEATIIEVVIEELSIPSNSKSAYIPGLRKQIIKTFAVFLSFFIGILLTIPFVTHAHPIVKIYTIISIALGLSLSLPLFIYFIRAFITPRLK